MGYQGDKVLYLFFSIGKKNMSLLMCMKCLGMPTSTPRMRSLNYFFGDVNLKGLSRNVFFCLRWQLQALGVVAIHWSYSQ
jgi:hypothetical protein